MRNMRRFLIVTTIATLWGQDVASRGLPLKAKAADYEFNGDAGRLQIGATYMGRSFAATPRESQDRQKTMLHDSGNFVVIEVGAFAAKTFVGELRIADFRLKINGQKITLSAAAPGLVANTLRNRDMDPQQKRMVYSGGMGGTDVMVGQPRQQSRFPGDPAPGQRRPAGTVTEEKAEQDWDVAIESALPEGPLQSGRAGNLFFEYSGKMTKAKTIVLEYEGSGGKVEIKLR